MSDLRDRCANAILFVHEAHDQAGSCDSLTCCLHERAYADAVIPLVEDDTAERIAAWLDSQQRYAVALTVRSGAWRKSGAAAGSGD